MVFRLRSDEEKVLPLRPYSGERMMADPTDELDTRESEARRFREEQQAYNDEFMADWRSEAADMAGMPLREKL